MSDPNDAPRRGRRFGPLIAGVLVLATVTGGALYLALHEPARVTAPPGVADGFDPLRRHAGFGWLPDGLVHRTTTVQAGDDGAITIDAGLPDTILGAQVTVTLFPPGVQPHATCLPALAGWPASLKATTSSPAPPVNGRPAQWLTIPERPNTPAVWLRWEYRNGASAVARAENLGEQNTRNGGTVAPATSQTVLQRIAGALVLRDDERLAFPFAVAGIPAVLHPVLATVTERSKNGWSAGLVFASGAYCPHVGDPTPGTLLVRVDAFVPGIGWGGGSSNTTVDGRRAQRQTGPGTAETLAVFDVPGPQVALQAGDADTTRQLGDDGLIGMYHRITVLATQPTEAADEPPNLTTWTTNPLR